MADSQGFAPFLGVQLDPDIFLFGLDLVLKVHFFPF